MAADNPAGVPIVGPGSPYITPKTLVAASTGISWSTIPDRNATVAQQLAEQLNICNRATAAVDAYCNQPLRATIDVEQLTGPGDFRCQVQANGNGRLLLSRRPVTAVLGGRVSSAMSFPASWATVDANQFRVENPLLGVYGTTAPGASGGGGQAVIVAGGWVSWTFGRLSSIIEVTYVNGWPHAGLTEPVNAGDMALVVDDITGWLGASGNILDDGSQENVYVTSVTPATSGAVSGAGTLGLSAGLAYPHEAGTLVTTLPASVQEACIYFAVSQALTRGATATAVQSISGSATGGGPASSDDYIKMAQAKIHAYRLVI